MKTSLRAILAASVLALVAGATLYAQNDREVVAERAPESAPAAPVIGTNGGSLPDFRTIARDNRSAVVSITVSGTDRSMEELYGENSPWGEFFRRFGHPQQQPNPRRQGSGSGFIISADGKILTNAHVIDEADEIKVYLADNREYAAKVLGMDKGSDVALIKIEAQGLSTVRLGDSDRLEVGEWVLAIGSPFGLSYSATQGIVSATGRALSERYVPFIQTDAAVNPGNSGGPLFNARGEVIGVNSQILSRSGGYMGLSFAIPINTVMNVAKQLEEKGVVERGWLGVSIQNVNQSLAKSFGLDRPRGALVGEVNAGSPAEEAGLQAGDVILSFDGQVLESSSDLPPLVGATQVGEKATLRVLRDGRERDIRVTIAKLPDELAGDAGAAPNTTPNARSEGRLGLALSALTAEQKEQLKIDRGVVVTEVRSGPAARAGVQRGDVIVEVNRQKVGTPQEVVEAVQSRAEDEPVLLLIRRQGGQIFLVVEPEASE